MSILSLDTDIKFIKGVGEKKAAILASEAQIIKVADLINYYPYKYIDRTLFCTIREARPSFSYLQIKGRITGFRLEGDLRKKRLVAIFTDDTGLMELVWFQGIPYIQQNYPIGAELVIFGKPNYYNGSIKIIHPEIELLADFNAKIQNKFEPAYTTSEKMKRAYMNSKMIQKLIHTVLSSAYDSIHEILPPALVTRLKILPRKDAYLNIHFPSNSEMLQMAQFRLKIEELLFLQLDILKYRLTKNLKFKGFLFPLVGEQFNTFYNEHLPFELTGAQKRVIKEIRKDLGSGRQMNRLLQGDVGSGKTLVALMCMLLAIDNGFQSAILAPTEILAQQHYKTIIEFLAEMNVTCRLLTGSTKTKERKIIHKELQEGTLNIIIGTHAIFEDVVQFHNLGFVVIDEQHRFGVEQRAKMWAKNIQPPHILVMTATPIPRTLAMTLYGDLDISVIDELPPGRKAIKTIHSTDEKRLRVFSFMREEIKKGRQIYIVYPLIQESEKMNYKDLEDGLESISRAFPPPEYAISVVHGKMKPEEKEKSMKLFAKGITHIMIATTVIEVGVNVPNASVMIIESAEKFGLSQLHQLRGRVGRGAEQSYCILMTPSKMSYFGQKRIETMVETTDGFRIAEVDLQLRGAGDLDGTQQSGQGFDLKISNLATDGQLVQYTRDIANEILEEDPNLELPQNQYLRQELIKKKKTTIDWSVIS